MTGLTGARVRSLQATSIAVADVSATISFCERALI